MKGFLCIPFALVFAFAPFKEAPTTEKNNQLSQILTSNPWKQVTYTVSPAIIMENGGQVNDLFPHLEEQTQNSIIKFDANGTYYLIKGQSFNPNDMMFAARNITSDTQKEDVQNDKLHDTAEDVSSDILESGDWSINDDGNLVLMANDGRMKEQILKVNQLGSDRFVVNFSKEIGGETHTFTQEFESQPLLELRW
jgi:hypothetical protein